ncbi:C4-dicarboxylate ABC transporter substrate-binding protein [Paroceanicella profunda]|uniref:C4-dicarboxylate ABC transporter substrate-binding protein n=1 Tax=Paroceanicella profunda TaxID=2579971 RepID=A0A5B8FHN6_9RHOB|nr:TRAP transporter substrate-binding protein DctP [Paroceanicella profunda]QDL92651.1 C4-dicarboxylate ABC transporter substrate-binding protein [Paroceanicella profunda]
MTRLNRFLRSAAIAGVLSGLAFGAAAEEVTLRAISAFPKPLYFSQSFQNFVDMVNERGKGVIRIDYIGGPEMFPPNQQVDAVRRGVVDMQYGPATYYLGKMPEADAWVGMTVSAAEARENGGFAIMQKAFSEKLNVELLAHADTGFNFHIYTLKEPKKLEDGSLDLDGLKIRSQPIYKGFFEGMGIIPVSVPVPDVYTGLERGTFDGSGWPILAIKDLSWDKFLRFRIDPGFFNSDLAVVMNTAKWEGLSEEAKTILTEVSAEYEKSSTAAIEATIEATDKQVRDEGMTVITLEGAAREKFLDAAYDSAWNRMKESGTPNYEELRKDYYSR